MRRSAAALITLLVLGAGTACSTHVAGHPTVADGMVARAPERGDCWQDREPGRGSPWDDPDRVACSEPHDAETISVSDAVLDAQAPYPTVANLSAPDDPIGKAVGDVCGYGMVAAYLGVDVASDIPPYGLYAAGAPRLPNREEWAAGARWVRCDAVFGVQSTDPVPGRMADGLKGPQAAAYHLCFTGTWDDYDIVSCAQPHDAEALRQPYQLDDVMPWPGDAKSRRELAQSCADGLPYEFQVAGLPAGMRLDVFLGPENTWLAGRIVACVLVPTAGGETSTTYLD